MAFAFIYALAVTSSCSELGAVTLLVYDYGTFPFRLEDCVQQLSVPDQPYSWILRYVLSPASPLFQHTYESTAERCLEKKEAVMGLRYVHLGTYLSLYNE